MRILPFARRILSPDQRKLATALTLALAVGVSACGRPAPPAPQAAPEASPPPNLAAAPAAQRAPAPAPAAGYRAGIWLEGKWIAAGVIERQVAALVKDLAARGITDLYVRTGPFQADGSLRLPDAARVTAMRRAAAGRGLRLWAWVPGLRRRLDLSVPTTVNAAAASAAKLADRGFDGVQIDLEPTADSDAGYVRLLAAIQGALPKGKLLGAATHLIRPQPARAEWSAAFFAQVAGQLDQVAVMAYDTYAASPEEFRAIVAYQTQTALARSPRSTEVLIGVPTYEDRTERHTPETEPLWAGLAGVADGFHRSDLSGRVTGWALYAAFTTSESEWKQFRERPR